MLLPRRLLSSCPRLYGRVLVAGVCGTLLVCLLYRATSNQVQSNNGLSNSEDSDSGRGEVMAEAWQSGAAGPMQRRRFEAEILKELAMQRPGLGEKGAPAHLQGEEAERGRLDLARIAMNEELSKHLSYNRTTPEGRNPHCKRLRYDTKKLPSAAVIIIFYDEAFSVVVRTVHSVLNTASENLKEVILVDDASTHEELHGKLEYYVATRFPKMVKLIRMKSR